MKKDKQNKVVIEKQTVKLKTCHVNPLHQWMADIDWCPYCNKTAQERIEYERKNPFGKQEQYDKRISKT